MKIAGKIAARLAVCILRGQVEMAKVGLHGKFAMEDNRLKK